MVHLYHRDMKSLATLTLLLSVQTTGISWIPFHSQTYPYSILQPSSFRHVLFKDTSNRSVDFFFPSLGSSTTNLNVYADVEAGAINEMGYLRALGGKKIHISGHILIDHKRRPLIAANFSGLAGKWTMEQVSFKQGGRVWHLTASYAVQYRSLRTIMLHMLRSFHPAP